MLLVITVCDLGSIKTPSPMSNIIILIVWYYALNITSPNKGFLHEVCPRFPGLLAVFVR